MKTAIDLAYSLLDESKIGQNYCHISWISALRLTIEMILRESQYVNSYMYNDISENFINVNVPQLIDNASVDDKRSNLANSIDDALSMIGSQVTIVGFETSDIPWITPYGIKIYIK